MKIVLLKDIRGLGKTGEIIDVADGYGRNYLIPQGLAHAADEQTLKIAANLRQKAVEKAKFVQSASEKWAKKLASRPLTFVLRADEKGHLYAGLKESEIFAKLSKEDASLDRMSVKFLDYEPLKSVGEHKVKLKLQDKLVEIKVIISAANEKEQKKRQN